MKHQATQKLLFKILSGLVYSVMGYLLISGSTLNAQTGVLNFARGKAGASQTGIQRKVADNGSRGLQVTYLFPGAQTTEKTEGNTAFQLIHMEDFGTLRAVGKPALPVRYDLVLIPKGAKTALKVTTSTPVTFHNILACPALKPATDREGDPEPVFEIDTAFYQSNVKYPESPVKIIKIFQIKGMDVALVRVCPLQYLPASRTLKAFYKVSYQISFTGSDDFFAGQNPGTDFLDKLSNVVLNQATAKMAAEALPVQKSINGPPVNYLIITHNNYLEAADSLAEWKSQLGYSCEIVSAPSWTSAQVKSAIQLRYQQWNPKPEYMVILGDHDLVPGEIRQDPMYADNFATDLYYVCMDGVGDNIPDMAFGRISVSSSTQAMSVVRKIIRYEKNPPVQTAFYESGVNCGYFQDDDSNSFEDRRFALTEEELTNYMVAQQGFNITRIYNADNDVTPLYWNNDYYAAGEPVPAYLRKPTFAWDGDKYDIRDELNNANGRLFITHRDHGYVGGSGWADPQFTTTDINMLNNGDRTPVVFSINCHTGEYQLPECFSEKFLRVPNGGAVGVFGAAYYSYSGYNDGLILGMFDAIWPNPGILPDFTGYADSPVGSPTAHSALYSMGDVMNQGMLRMMQTWGDDSYTHELFHYFGDPAMRIWTEAPFAIAATHTDSLFCGDTLFEVFSSDYPTALATLVVNGQLVASTVLTAGAGTLHFAPLGGTRVLFTLSEHNYRPYVAVIPIDSGCVHAAFNVSDSGLCVGKNFQFNNASEGNITSYLWNFGDGALPAMATTAGPHTVQYTTPGTKTISLTVTGSAGQNTTTTQLDIEQVCSYAMIPNGLVMFESCNGILTDNGGPANYSASSDDTAVIVAPGATNLQLFFNDFDIEPGSGAACDYDRVSIYDGPSTGATLLGTWCNSAGQQPPAFIITSANSFTAVFHSDSYTQMRGFDIEWSCIQPMSPPNTNFAASEESSCTGDIRFYDHTLNAPSSWHWDFGDGDTSVLQNPIHVYQQNGVFSVSLTTTNVYGSNAYTRSDYISINRPVAPVTENDVICNNGTATLTATGAGTIFWYSNPVGGSVLDSGNTFTTPLLNATTSYYAENHSEELYFAAPSDSGLGNGAYYYGTSNHYLRFDALTDITLVSVKVYAQTSAIRKISLRNASGVIIYDTSALINAGAQRIYLNFPIAEGTGYRLQCDSLNRLYRNGAGAEFPYTIPEVISITGNSYTNQLYYYFFYDWELQRTSCISPRAEAVAYVHSANPVADFTFSVNSNTFEFADQSTDAADYLWDFGDGNNSTLQNPAHTYAANGTYLVRLTVTNGCGSDTKTDTVDFYTVGLDNSGTKESFILQPNPAHDFVTLTVQGKPDGDIVIEIIDMTGRIVTSTTNHVSRHGQYTIQTGDLPAGVYIVTIRGKGLQQYGKLLKY